MTRHNKFRFIGEMGVILCRGEACLARAVYCTISPKINAKTEHFLPVEACLNPTDHDINLPVQSEFSEHVQ